MKSYVLSVLVDNNPGVMTRVCGLFNRRGYNLDSVTAGVTEDERISRLTLTSTVEAEEEMQQIIRQIKKLEDVHKVILLDENNSVCKEIVMVKVKAQGIERQEIINLTNIFRAAIVDVSTNTFTIEITGDRNKISAFIDILEPFGIAEVVRSGFIAIKRGNESI